MVIDYQGIIIEMVIDHHLVYGNGDRLPSIRDYSYVKI